MWKLYESQISVPINKAVLEHSHVHSFHIVYGCFCSVKTELSVTKPLTRPELQPGSSSPWGLSLRLPCPVLARILRSPFRGSPLASSRNSPPWQSNGFLALSQPSDSMYQLAAVLSTGSWFPWSVVFLPWKAQSILLNSWLKHCSVVEWSFRDSAGQEQEQDKSQGQEQAKLACQHCNQLF